MYSEEHYLSKIQRNSNLVGRLPENMQNEFIQHIQWATQLSSRLDMLDYAERNTAIDNIHRILDDDYSVIQNEIGENKNTRRI